MTIRYRRISVSVFLLLLTLAPMKATVSAVAYCSLGPLVCVLGGFVLSKTRLGRRVAHELHARLAGLPELLLRPSPRTFLLTVAGASLLLCTFSSVWLFERSPGVSDSALYLFQARILATGHCFAPAPALPEFFATPSAIVDADKWYAQYPPGYPALLAGGVLLGCPWLVNPLCTALACVFVYLAGRHMFSEGVARVASILMAFSPFVVLMAGDYMSHSSALLFVTLFMWGVTWYDHSGSPAAITIAALSAATAFAIRPYTAIAVCLPVAMWCGYRVLRSRCWRSLLLGLVGAALPLIGVGAYNRQTTGSALVFGYTKLYGAAQNPGFGAHAGGGHTPLRGALQTLTNLNALNKDMFQMPFPALMLPAAALAFGCGGRWMVLLLLSFASLTFFYFLYFGHDLIIGPRFLFESLPALMLLSALGGRALWQRWRQFKVSRRTRDVVWLAILMAFILGVGLGVVPRVRKVARGYGDPTVVRAVQRQGLTQALVFLPGYNGPRYLAGFASNDPFLMDGVIYVADLGTENGRLLRLYPGWRALRWDGVSLVDLRRGDSPAGHEAGNRAGGREWPLGRPPTIRP